MTTHDALKIHRLAALVPVLLAASLAACGAEDNPSTAGDTSSTGEASDTPATGSDSPATATEDSPTTGTDPTAASDTTAALDPCDSCSPDATCDGDRCTCKDGYDGDGEQCDDIDECSSKNDCSVDATCTNTPGSYDCACNDGYKGDGESCKDIDECNEDLDNCSPNADCTNQDGGFKCECKDGFTGDGVVCNGSALFGETCKEAQDCASGLCLLDAFDMCTETCSQAVANDCGAQGLTGLCIDVGNNTAVCAGKLTFGDDPDDEVLQVGDQIQRDFQSKTDQDLFLINLAPGTYQVVATPDPDDDIEISFYGGNGVELATVNNFGIGQFEGGEVDHGGGILFAVVRNIGNSNGSYTIQVTAV